MKNIKLLIILVIILIVAVIEQKSFISKSQKQVNILKPTKSSAPSVTPTPTVFQNANNQNKNVQMPTTTPIPTQTANNNTDISSFIYLNSTTISSGNKNLILQSFDDPQVITNWYKDRITNIGMSAKSFITTNTNGDILNKLAGANGSMQVEVTISKKSSESRVKIKIEITP